MRQLFTKFRVSDHSLEIETGRYKHITREERICKNCNLNEIGDEYHFFLKSFSNVFFLYESFITFLIFFSSECFI
jgi:hypothetical protein